MQQNLCRRYSCIIFGCRGDFKEKYPACFGFIRKQKYVYYTSSLKKLYRCINERESKYTDEEGRVWYPIVLNIETAGTVLINGGTAENAQWSAIKVIELTEEEKAEPKYKGKTHKSDAKSLKYFGEDFIEACDYINIFKN